MEAKIISCLFIFACNIYIMQIYTNRYLLQYEMIHNVYLTGQQLFLFGYNCNIEVFIEETLNSVGSIDNYYKY